MPLSGEYEPSASTFAREQAETIERTNGAEGSTWEGHRVVVLTSIGAKTGKLRKTVLMRVEHNGQYAAVASRDGAPKHPVWYWNLVKHPHVELQDGAVRQDYIATLTDGADREFWWERAVKAWPLYTDYQSRTTRSIPIFLLTPFRTE
ncbi:nitroreductase family deazaflavin-dependent oxidoreductase [Rhodococcus sp. WS1]|uniref:nitroreductase family deazaflavin-dependent oxidoreductase n=1 Tax=unclassified Rhodococcus (in: high G+C Gram-positive bacteria) TaxID=192944 RepID=UPI0011449521|nr:MULTISPECIES: nitroreductase family deazaflavin-dependent oxidoreductase [unclassified Rhodococcus (in: high G+C Gram-positive bacteria)]ROZ52897.1 nitroreductase family deazaflavin-dependent oxidoreductase [Rhodococcus sp. WS1]TQC35988.1 nitroreductase family deazaflavin-dependent oxidoreductase [Rhodococcus sp. WS7]